jgi:glycine hydroxymethyltransferase
LVGLSTNKNMIPYDPRKPLDPSGIRVWTPAATTRWMKENEMKIIARIFTDAIKALQEAKWYNSQVEDKSNMEVFENVDLQRKLKTLKTEVLELCKKFPIYK